MTKRIWMWSFVFGLFAAMIAYFALFSSGNSSPASAGTETASAPVVEEEELDEEVVDEGIPPRELNNPMVQASEGKRAISLRVINAEEGVSGYIEPNSRVDIIAYETNIEEEEGKEKEYLSAVLVLENVLVLASGLSSSDQEEAMKYQTVTVEVSPEDGVMLSLAAKDEEGFYFMLRNPEDDKVLKEPFYKNTREVVKREDKE